MAVTVCRPMPLPSPRPPPSATRSTSRPPPTPTPRPTRRRCRPTLLGISYQVLQLFGESDRKVQFLLGVARNSQSAGQVSESEPEELLGEGEGTYSRGSEPLFLKTFFLAFFLILASVEV